MGGRSGPRHILGVPIVDPIKYRAVLSEVYTSDSNGCVKIPDRIVTVRLYEDLYSETITVNVDAEPGADEPGATPQRFFSSLRKYLARDLGTIFNPMEEYGGAVVYSSLDTVFEEHQSELASEHFTIIWKSKGLRKEEDSFVIRLNKVLRGE